MISREDKKYLFALDQRENLRSFPRNSAQKFEASVVF